MVVDNRCDKIAPSERGLEDKGVLFDTLKDMMGVNSKKIDDLLELISQFEKELEIDVPDVPICGEDKKIQKRGIIGQMEAYMDHNNDGLQEIRTRLASLFDYFRG